MRATQLFAMTKWDISPEDDKDLAGINEAVLHILDQVVTSDSHQMISSKRSVLIN
jgi:hypothetical protein